MGLIRWLTHNVADTDAGTHADLAPLELPIASAGALGRVAEAVRSLPRWRVEAVDEHAGVIRATRRTRVLGFVDDVTVRVECVAQAVRVHARSQSRLGKGDLGQNRRNLRELFAALRAQLGQS